MGNFTIEINYLASIVKTVDAVDEGDALNKARDMAEESDINEFVLVEERESRILATNY